MDITFTSALKEDSSEDEKSEEETERVAVFDAEGNLVSSVVSSENDVGETRKNKFEPNASKKNEKFVLQKEWSHKKGGVTSKKMHKKQSDLIDSDPNACTNFNVNLEDDRFKAVYDSPAFAIDPTAPMYKKTKGMEAIIDERQKRRRVHDK